MTQLFVWSYFMGMIKTIQLLLLCALFPTIGNAREETREERKARIVRKYLREKMTITQSDLVVPTDLPEDEQITDSEKFREQDGSILRQEEGTATPLPAPPRPQPVPRVNSNWLLSDVEDGSDGFSESSDPYGAVSDGAADWSSWENKTRTETMVDSSRRDSRNDSYISEDSRRVIPEQRAASIFGRRPDSTYSGSSFSSRTDSFNPAPERSTFYNSSLNLQGNQANAYGSDPSQGMLSTPFPQLNGSSSSERRTAPSGYQPYQSPYAQERERRQQGIIPQTSSQEFSRPDAYDQWKGRNKSWDPTKDDAYINEMMPKNNR
ncbi:hypothetical protein P4E94_15820 [Pontiellaceae bacterium B12219]|nr:hypothetical protein [Pontiellaceae bacterium B12219]